MPVLKRPDGEIHYEEYGQGYPILLFAPGGMRSRMEMWPAPAGGPPRPWSDWTQSLAGHYRVIAMDQLGFHRFHTLGGCIGGSFCLKLCEIAPDRITAAVLQNPIGLHPDHPEYFPESFAEWAAEMKAE